MVLQLCTTNKRHTVTGRVQAQPTAVRRSLRKSHRRFTPLAPHAPPPTPTPWYFGRGGEENYAVWEGAGGGASLGGTDERPWGPGYVDMQLTTRWSCAWGPVLTFTSTDAEYMASSMGTSHATTLMRGHRPAAQPNAVACTVSTGTSSGQSRLSAPSNIPFHS